MEYYLFLINYFGKAKLSFKVSPNVFYPKPNVHSAVVHIYFNEISVDNQSFNSIFKSIVKSSFGNRRKTLKNSLGNSIFAEVDFSECGIDLSLRAEQLNLMISLNSLNLPIINKSRCYNTYLLMKKIKSSNKKIKSF